MDALALPDLDQEIQPLANCHLGELARIIQLIEQVSHRMLEALREDNVGHKVLLALGARIYNHLLAGELLFRKGLLTDTMICVRGATEDTFLFLFLIEDKQRMEKWLGGAKYKPKEVRRSIAPDLMNKVYGGLSNIAHPNVTALETYALINYDSVSVSFGPTLPRKPTVVAFFMLLQTTALFLGTITLLLKATREEELSASSERVLQEVDKVLDGLKARLSEE